MGNIQRFGPTKAGPPGYVPESKPAYVGEAKGVLPGYTGYVPAAKMTHGISHYGSIQKAAPSQKGHGADVKGDKNIDVGQGFSATTTYKAGYSGHIPRARDTFGGAHYGIGSHGSPDDYDLENKLAGTGTKMSDFRLVKGSDAGNSEYASDEGGAVFGANNHLAEFHNYAKD